jgi:hypothetical protein
MDIKNRILSFACTLLAGASLLQAQQEEHPNSGVGSDSQVTLTDPTPAPMAAISGGPTTATPTAIDQTAPATAGGPDNQWHLSVSPYLWFPGVHGTLGAKDRAVGIHASAIDLLSHFRFGIMGTAEATHNRILIPIDLMFVRLRDDKGIPLGAFGATTATVTANEFILTPKIGVTVIKAKMLQVDALAGFRYWHFGENLSFSPSILGLNFSRSQNWVDPLVGGRFTVPLSPKLAVTAAGDVGGWGVGSQLDYQVVGLLGYKVKPHMTLQAGYRYLFVDYAAGGIHGGVLIATTSGIIFGATINLK